MADWQKIVGGIIIAVISVTGLVWGASVAIDYGTKEYAKWEQQRKLEAEEDKKVMDSISKTQSIENQKIKIIDGNSIELENGTKLTVEDPTKNDCQVGDTIRSYEDSLDGFKCERSDSTSGTSTGHYVHIPRTSPAILDYFIAWSFLRNNGYSYSPTTSSFVHPSGRSYEVNKSTDGKTTSVTKSTRTSGGKSTTTGHGGVSGGKSGTTGTS